MNKKRWLIYITVAAVMTFNNWILGIFLNWRLFKGGGSVSEFSALDQPHHWIFRSLDTISGLLFCLIAWSVYKLAPNTRFWRWLALGTLVLGVANCLDAILPLPCSGTVDTICNAPVRISLQRVSLPDHVFSSVVIGLCYVLVPLAIFLRSKRLADRYNQALGLIVLVSTLMFFGLLVSESFFESSFFGHLTGYSQELQMLLLAWLYVRVAKSLSEHI